MLATLTETAGQGSLPRSAAEITSSPSPEPWARPILLPSAVNQLLSPRARMGRELKIQGMARGTSVRLQALAAEKNMFSGAVRGAQSCRGTSDIEI